MEGDVTWGGDHTIQCTDGVLYDCTAETYIILLTKVTPINSIKKYTYTHKHDGKLFSLKNKEGNPAICDNIDESGWHYAK